MFLSWGQNRSFDNQQWYDITAFANTYSSMFTEITVDDSYIVISASSVIMKYVRPPLSENIGILNVVSDMIPFSETRTLRVMLLYLNIIHPMSVCMHYSNGELEWRLAKFRMNAILRDMKKKIKPIRSDNKFTFLSLRGK